MRDVVFVEVLAIVERLQPKLAKSFSLTIRSDDPIYANEAGEPNAIEAFLIKNGRGVADALCNICNIYQLCTTLESFGSAYSMQDRMRQ